MIASTELHGLKEEMFSGEGMFHDPFKIRLTFWN